MRIRDKLQISVFLFIISSFSIVGLAADDPSFKEQDSSLHLDKVGCRQIFDTTSSEMISQYCAAGEVAVSGGCWRINSGVYIGDRPINDEKGSGWQCRIEGGNGVRLWTVCCKTE